jgi:hypothetical protein
VSDFFSSVEFENYGPIKKGTLKLTRLHALIGPNKKRNFKPRN